MTTQLTVESRIRNILSSEHCVHEISVDETLEHAGLDSLDRVEFWMQIEDEFNLPETDPKDEDSCETISQVVAYIEGKRAH